MLHVPKDRTTVETWPSPPGTTLVIDYMRVQGAARSRLRRRFGPVMADSLGAIALPLNDGVMLGAASDSGARPRNEDSAVVLLAHLGNGQDAVSVVFAAVADGMGGHADGDLASAVTLQIVTEAVFDEMLGEGRAGGRAKRDPSRRVEDVLVEAVASAHRAVMADTVEGGSTLTCVLVVEGAATIAHVGDSRAYLLGGAAADGIELLTHDHRLVEQLLAVGLVKEEEVPNHPQRAVLYRAIGYEDSVTVDTVYRDMGAGSRLLLCSDGIWEALSEAELRRIILDADHPQHACEKLVDAALAHSARDDMTAVLVQIPYGVGMIRSVRSDSASISLGSAA